MSKIKALIREHEGKIEELRNTCEHPAEMISFRTDHSVVGRGSSLPSVHLTCTNCGMGKTIFELLPNKYHTVRKTMEKQGFKDERTGLYFQHDWELELTDARRKT